MTPGCYPPSAGLSPPGCCWALGNVLGMWWAYAELGWGGYWAWDPVENAGLMPWLLITAFLHSGMMYLRRGLFKTWTVILAIAAFWLTIFGAFLTRSNVAGSVHTFGQTPMTPVFIVFLAITLIGSVWLLIDRRKYIKSEEGDDALISGTGTFLAVNLLLVISTVFIFIGTTVPVFSSIVPAKSYFNVVNLPIFLLIILLAGFCVLVGWKKPDLKKLNRQLLWPAAGAVLLLIIPYHRPRDGLVCCGALPYPGGCIHRHGYEMGRRCGRPHAR